MKKLLMLLITCLIMNNYAVAQEIGIRFGDVSGGNVAIDAIFGIAEYSRIHADVSFGNGVGIDVLWDFLYRPLGNEELKWYVGVGPYTRIDDPFYLGVVAEGGLEYRFKGIPLVVGADWRPALSIIETTDFYYRGFGLNVRYVIGKKSSK